MILVISRDKDFSNAVAEQVRRELKLDCTVAADMGAAKPMVSQASLIVTDEPLEKPPVPMLATGAPPIRMKALLADIARSQAAPSGEPIMLGEYSFSIRQKELAHLPSKKTATLTDKEAQLLAAIAQAGKKGIGKDELLKQVWSIAADLNTHTLETHIYRLRGKFKDVSGRDDMIVAVDGGYKLA